MAHPLVRHRRFWASNRDWFNARYQNRPKMRDNPRLP